MDKNSSNIFRDHRLDKIITWILCTLVTICLGMGAWFFKGLNDSHMEERKERISFQKDLTTTMKEFNGYIYDLKGEISKLNQNVPIIYSNKDRIAELKKDVLKEFDETKEAFKVQIADIKRTIEKQGE